MASVDASVMRARGSFESARRSMRGGHTGNGEAS
jgi:hypothetical protein